jgi:hypothetical protein
LTALAIESAPLTYPVPPTAEVHHNSVRAQMDRSGTAGSWLPAVQLGSDSGHVLATASDQGSVVAAGGSADASFFPGVKQTQTSTPSTSTAPFVATFYRSTFVAGDAPQTIAAGSTDNLVWPHAALPSTGEITGPTIGNVYVTFNVACMVDQWLYVGWEDGNYEKAGVIGTNSRIVPADVVSSANYIPAGSPLRVDTNDWGMYAVPNAAKSGDLLHAYAINGDTVARDVNEAWLVIRGWAASGYNGNIPGWPQ